MGHGKEYLRWAEFEAEAPRLAARGRALIEHFGFVFVGTVRRDGSPRISPVEAHLVEGHLMVVMIPATKKAGDLLQDPRIVVQTPITSPAHPGSELKLRGRVVEVKVPDVLRETADQIEAVSGWRPQPSWRFFEIEVAHVALVDWEKGEMLLARWDSFGGSRLSERRRLDPSAGSYVSVREAEAGEVHPLESW